MQMGVQMKNEDIAGFARTLVLGEDEEFAEALDRHLPLETPVGTICAHCGEKVEDHKFKARCNTEAFQLFEAKP